KYYLILIIKILNFFSYLNRNKKENSLNL
ncbi:hypothetical protein Mgra_00009170, partial [Meloidogyne graminicola]